MNKGKQKEKKELYSIICNLPYSEYEEIYKKNYEEIIKSEELNQNFKDYLKNKHGERKIWVKCYLKSKFTCEMVTSSRIESKHNLHKKYLNGNSRISKLYTIFQDLEKLQIIQKKFKDLQSNKMRI